MEPRPTGPAHRPGRPLCYRICLDCGAADHHSLFGPAVDLHDPGWSCRWCLCPLFAVGRVDLG